MNEQSDHYDPDERAPYRHDHNLTHRSTPSAAMLIPADGVKRSHSMFLYSHNA
jgi:hypothetical protein